MGWIILAIIWLAALLIARSMFRRERWRTPWHLDLAALGLLALAVLGFFWRVVTGQNWMPADGGDLVSFLYPTYRFAAASLAQGAWPLWNPYVYGGAPHVGDIQAGFLYPPNLLLFLTNPRFSYRALQTLSMAHVWFAGAGMFLLLARGFALRRVAALAGALAFMFSDAFLTHFGNLNLNAVLSWLPWIFWAWLAVLARLPHLSRAALRRGPAVLALALAAALPGVLLAVATLAGHIQATLFIALALAGATAFWLHAHRADRAAGWRTLLAGASLALALGVTALLVAPVLLPSLQLAGATGRAAWTYGQAAGYSLSPAQVIGWLIPSFFGRGPQFHWGAWPRVEVGYLGILPLILAGLAVALRRQADGKIIWPLAALAGASFVLALGIYAIPHGWLTLLPGFGQLRAPARFIVLTDFCVAALAAWGLDALLHPLTDGEQQTVAAWTRGLTWVAGAAFGILTPLAYLALLLVQDKDPAIVIRVSITLIAVVTFAGLLGASLAWLSARRKNFGPPITLGWLAVALIFVDVASLGAYQDLGETDPSATFEHAGIAAYLAAQPGPYRIDSRTQIEALWQPDAALLYGLEDVTGVANPLLLLDFERYWGALGSRSTRLYDLLNVKYVLGKKDVVLDWDKFALAYDGDPGLNVYENRRALPRAFIAPLVQLAPSHAAALEAIRAEGFDPTVTAVIEGSAAAASGGLGAVTDLATGPNRLSFRARADAPALVFISQVWYPGWQVAIDGRAAGAPLRADYLFQAVNVPGGEHLVELRFVPALWRAGWLLAGGASLVLVIGLVWMITRRKHGD